MPFADRGPASLYYESRGRGPAVLLVMGLGMTLAAWWRTVPVLAASFRVLTFDNRGVGRSEPAALPYTVAQMADDAIAVLDAAGEDAAHVYGISLGGMVAQEAALRHPERVRALVLGATTPGGSRAPWGWAPRRPRGRRCRSSTPSARAAGTPTGSPLTSRAGCASRSTRAHMATRSRPPSRTAPRRASGTSPRRRSSCTARRTPSCRSATRASWPRRSPARSFGCCHAQDTSTRPTTRARTASSPAFSGGTRIRRCGAASRGRACARPALPRVPGISCALCGRACAAASGLRGLLGGHGDGRDPVLAEGSRWLGGPRSPSGPTAALAPLPRRRPTDTRAARPTARLPAHRPRTPVASGVILGQRPADGRT